MSTSRTLLWKLPICATCRGHLVDRRVDDVDRIARAASRRQVEVRHVEAGDRAATELAGCEVTQRELSRLTRIGSDLGTARIRPTAICPMEIGAGSVVALPSWVRVIMLPSVSVSVSPLLPLLPPVKFTVVVPMVTVAVALVPVADGRPGCRQEPFPRRH